MKWHLIVNVINTGSLVWLGLTGLPAVAQTNSTTNLNGELSQAVCQQDWGRAIRVVDRMRVVTPVDRRGELTVYRNRLQAMLNSQTVIPNWQCNASGNPTLPATPTAVASPVRPTVANPGTAMASPVRPTVTNPDPGVTTTSTNSGEAVFDSTIRGVRPGTSSSPNPSSPNSTSGTNNLIDRARNLNQTIDNP